MADSSDTLQTLAQAQLALASSIAKVLEVVGGQPAVPFSKKSSITGATSNAGNESKPTKRRARRGPKASDLDRRVLEILESRPGTSVAELEREIADPDLSRSRLEWSLRRLLESGQIEKSGKTCGSRYSVAKSTHPAPSSSLRVVES